MTKKLTVITDEMLARSAAKGDRAAFSEIVQRYGRPLTEFAASRAPTYEDAEDAVQETFFRVYQNLDSYDCRYSLKNWMFTIAYNYLISVYRKKKPLRLADDPTDSIDASSVEETDRGYEWLWEAAGQMKPDMHSCLWLRYKQDMPIPEIAKIMDRSENSVRVLLHRARKQLTKMLATNTTAPLNSKHTAIPCFERTS